MLWGTNKDMYPYFRLVPSILYSYLMFMASTLQYRFLSSECSSVSAMFCKVLTWYLQLLCFHLKKTSDPATTVWIPIFTTILPNTLEAL
ncbi:hypothetical protein Peur_015902 [Populus x canadensis]